MLNIASRQCCLRRRDFLGGLAGGLAVSLTPRFVHAAEPADKRPITFRIVTDELQMARRTANDWTDMWSTSLRWHTAELK